MRQIIPRELTVPQINQLFEVCLAKEHSATVIRVVLFQKENGFEQDSKAVYFDAATIKKAKPQLEYSMGQLKDAHLKRRTITHESVRERYDNVRWAAGNTAVFAYLHMLLAAGLITPIKPNGEMTVTTEIIPTLLLNDKNYSVWIKENEAALSYKYYGE